MNDALLSSKNMGWRTPPSFVKLVKSFAPIVLDPATDAANPVEAETFYTPPGDGLVADWRAESMNGLVYCNPPYGRSLAAWADKFRKEGTDGCHLIALTPARTDTKWWQDMITADVICFLRGRLRFHEQKADGSWGAADAAPFPCAVSYWGEHEEGFAKIFETYGWIVHP